MRVDFYIEWLVDKTAPFFGYEDYRVTGETDLPFYIGIGNSDRPLCKDRNETHGKICDEFGLRRVVVTQSFDRASISEWEINRIQELREDGVFLANIADGGSGCWGKRLYPARNRANGKITDLFAEELGGDWVPIKGEFHGIRTPTRFILTQICRAVGMPIARGSRKYIVGEYTENWLDNQPESVQSIIYNMLYQRLVANGSGKSYGT